MKTSMLFTFNVVVAIAIGLSSSPAFCQNLFDDLRIDDRSDGAIWVSWLVNGNIKDVEGCRITIESPLKDGAIGVELNAAETLSLLGPDNRHHYKFQPITNDISHGVTVELLKGGRVATETVHIESARKCYEPDIEENGCLEEKIHYPVPSGTVVTYCCNIGYGLYDPGTESCTGVKQAVCQDGVWTIPPPQCTRQCEEPSETPKEDWLKEFMGDAKLSRSKREGVDHIDPCVPGCADPGTPENGLQVGRHAYPVCSRTGVSFECEDDYRLVGRHTIVCDDGHWSGPIPSCVEGCSDPGYPEHGGQYGTMEYPAEEGTEVTFYCDPGYGLIDPDTNECKESTTSTCADGMWTEAVPLCKAKCEDPGTPMEGRQPVHRFYPVCSGTVVQFECHYMHRLIGDERIQCIDGHWTNPSPSCEVMCKDPGSPDNGGQTESMQYPAISGAKVSYYCDDGYQLYDGNTNACIEELSITCSDGSWTNSMPLCVQKCNNPGVPEHGYQKEGYQYPVCHGTELSFACTEKHNLVGEDTIKCTDGEWSAALPLCTPCCDDPGTPDNGHVLDDHAYPVDAGTIVRYCCDEGYDLVGETAARCNEDGEWTSQPPVCVGRCDDPGAPEYGYQTLQLEYPVKSGTSVTFACNPGYSLSGSGTSTCIDGQWVPPAEGNSCTEIDECSSNPCMNGGTCIDGFDRYDCLCPINYEGQNCESEYGICYVWGDPHYLTYDGEKYEFQGQCSYILTESASSSLTRFKVVVDNEAWTTLRDDEVSVTAQLIVTVHGKDIRLLRNLDVYVDDEPVTLPIQPLPDVYVRRTGRYVTVVSDFGLTVRWDGNHQGDVKVHGEYKDTLRGLCGNFNGDPSDDFTDPNGLLIPDGMEHTHRAAMFGNSWVSNEEECDSVAGGCNPCASDVDIADEAYDLCKVIKDEHGPFAACHPTIDPDQFFSACMFDVCSKLPDKSGVCMNAEAYAQVCLDNRVALSWRTEDTCPITCVNDRVYSNTISPCVKTCHDARPHYACVESRLVEGCTCPDGLFVNHRGSCVQAAECGCTVDENYLPYGDSFVKEHCDEECTCVTDGRLDCVAIRCDPNAYCGDEGGVRNCYCEEGYHGNGKKCEGYHCYSEPCQNNATCIELSSTYRCECLAGWQGDNCEEDIDECASNPCQNGGTCIDKVNGYECICTTEWKGPNCESEKPKGECDDPGTPENGLQVDGHEYPVPSGTTVTYACYSGFDLVGAQQIQCFDGEWTDSVPECVEQELELRQCGDPGTPDNGGLVDPVTFPVSSGTTIEYECDDYYDLFGSETITCDDGTWTPEMPGVLASM
ncbi:zonadhesin-like [Ptychodera flava]|uniref:zonadhesin-like n=1 Tax=Ptychodera flava TaxID=63121 RepID=UPI00396A38AB